MQIRFYMLQQQEQYPNSMGAALTISIGELALSATDVGLSITVAEFQNSINDLYNAHKNQLNTLHALYESMQQMGIGDNHALMVDVTHNFVTQNFQMMNNTLNQQLSGIQQTINQMDNTFTINYQNLTPTNIGMGASLLGLGAYIISFTKKYLPKLWKKTIGTLGKFGSEFIKGIRAYFKKTPVVTQNEEDGTLGVDEQPPVDPPQDVDDQGQVANAGWWKKMTKIQVAGHVFKFVMIGAMIAGVVMEAIQVNDLINQLKQAQDYFGANGTFQKNLASVDSEMKQFIGFYSSIVYTLRQSVESMSVMFYVRAFLNRTGSANDINCGLGLNYNKFGLNDALVTKSNNLLNAYNSIIKQNLSLQDRINSYGPILTEFLQPYAAPELLGNSTGTITPPRCFSTVLSALSNLVSTNSVTMSNYYVSLQNLLQVGDACKNYILTRPSDFSTLTPQQKQTVDQGIWTQCENYYGQVILNSNTLWTSDIQALTGILMNYVDQFYYDDLEGKSINNYKIIEYKWKNTYKDLVAGAKQLGQSMNIPFSTPNDEEFSATQMLTDALAYAQKDLSKYPILSEAQSINQLTTQNCSNLQTYIQLNTIVVQAKDSKGNVIDTDQIQILYCLTFNFHSKNYTFEYTKNSVNGAQTFTQAV